MTALARPSPVVLAAPSGAGKTTIAHALVNGSREFVFSVSATTRPPRPGERNCMDYDFVARAEFEAMLERNELVEWAEVHGHLYGTPRRNLETAQSRCEHVILDIDVQGARQIRERVPEAILIFIFPPSAEALVRRLTVRGTEKADEVVRRLRSARSELAQARLFDHVVVNEDLEQAVAQVRAIVTAERLRPSRVLDLDERIEHLKAGIDQLLVERFGREAPERRAIGEG